MYFHLYLKIRQFFHTPNFEEKFFLGYFGSQISKRPDVRGILPPYLTHKMHYNLNLPTLSRSNMTFRFLAKSWFRIFISLFYFRTYFLKNMQNKEFAKNMLVILDRLKVGKFKVAPRPKYESRWPSFLHGLLIYIYISRMVH